MADEPFLRRDYRGWWRLPEPLPPRPPWELLWIVAAELMLAVVWAEGEWLIAPYAR